MEGTAHDYQKSTVAVAKALGLALPEIPGWTCCGSTSAHQTDPLLALALPAKNLIAAEGKTVAVGCAACYNRLKTANHEIASDPETRKTVADVVGKDYDGQTKILHLLEILARDIGTAKIAQAVKKPLKGLKLVTYYGCLLSRPPEVTKFDDPENPTLMDQVLEAAGATILEWPHKTECCGAGYSITDVGIVKRSRARSWPWPRPRARTASPPPVRCASSIWTCARRIPKRRPANTSICRCSTSPNCSASPSAFLARTWVCAAWWSARRSFWPTVELGFRATR